MEINTDTFWKLKLYKGPYMKNYFYDEADNYLAIDSINEIAELPTWVS